MAAWLRELLAAELHSGNLSPRQPLFPRVPFAVLLMHGVLQCIGHRCLCPPARKPPTTRTVR